MILFAKRFRSKAPSAASLSPGQLADRRRVGFDFLPTPYCDTVSGERGSQLAIGKMGYPGAQVARFPGATTSAAPL